jgi:hypothetical protein
MIPILLILFLLLASVSAYIIIPLNKTQIWLSAILIPLITLIFYVIYCISQYSYYAGGQAAKAFLPAIISGFVIYCLLIDKLKRHKKQEKEDEINVGENITIDGKTWQVGVIEETEIMLTDNEGFVKIIAPEEFRAIRNKPKIKVTPQQTPIISYNEQKQNTPNNKKNWWHENKGITIFIMLLFIPFFIALLLDLNNLNNENDTKRENGEITFKDVIKQSKTVDSNYEGLSFSYPDDWEIEKVVIQEDFSFQVNCTKGLFSSDVFMIVWLRTTLITPSEATEVYIESMKEEPSHKNAKTTPLYNGRFKGENSVSVDFTVSLLGTTFYGTITSFIMNENIVSITKQSDSKEKLSTEFKIMEESINVEIPK